LTDFELDIGLVIKAEND